MPIMPASDKWDSTAQQAGAYALYAIGSPIVGLLRVGVSGYYLFKHLYVNNLKPKFNKAHREAMERLNHGTLPGHAAQASGGPVVKGKKALRAGGRAVEGLADQAEALGQKFGRVATGTNTHDGWKEQFKRGLAEITLIGGIAYAILEMRDEKKPEEFAGVDKVVDLVEKEMMWSQGLKTAKKAAKEAFKSTSSSSSEGEAVSPPSSRRRRARQPSPLVEGVKARQAARKADAARKAKAKKD